LEFELAHSISLIDHKTKGRDLLKHSLSAVRKGAWIGIGKVGDISMIKCLIEDYQNSPIPWLRHSAYKAIDHILINIQAFSSKKETLNGLVSIKKLLRDTEQGLQTRIDWTENILKKRINKQMKL